MQLYVREAAGEYRVARPREILDGAREAVGRSFRAGRRIARPVEAAELFAGKLAGLVVEAGPRAIPNFARAPAAKKKGDLGKTGDK